jgi:hypothetical protein
MSLRQVRLVTQDPAYIKAHQIEEVREFIMQNGPVFFYKSPKAIILSSKPLEKWSVSFKTETKKC